MDPGTIMFFILLAVAGGVLALGYREIPSGFGAAIRLRQRIVGEILQEGPTFIVPYLMDLVCIEIRDIVDDPVAFQVLTKDAIEPSFDAVLSYRVWSPARALFRAPDGLTAALGKMVQAALFERVKKYTLQQIFEDDALIDELSEQALRELKNVEEDWGVDIKEFRLQGINIPDDVARAHAEILIATARRRALEEQAVGYEFIVKVGGVPLYRADRLAEVAERGHLIITDLGGGTGGGEVNAALLALLERKGEK